MVRSDDGHIQSSRFQHCGSPKLRRRYSLWFRLRNRRAWCQSYSDHIDETPVYVGKSCQTFRKRFKQHIDGDKLFLHKKGELYVRLGKIVEPQSLATYEKEERGYDRLLLTIESGLITELRNLGYKVMRNLTNVQQTNTYTLWYNLIIQNSGYRGLLPSEIDNRTHIIG